jgi:peptidoglycan hydrolase-like protein with peptidoglycan-binding domain
MKKITAVLIAAVIMNVLYAPVFAQTSTSQTSTSSLQALIDSLKQQIATLQAKISAAQQAQQQVQQTAQEVRGTLKLISGLREGMSGEQVKLLQTILAGDPSIYPEGKITGYFGALTAKAVKRFQKKFGVEQVGLVGPKTLEKLNKWLENNPLTEEESDKPGEGKRFCVIVPPGHLIAPGWLRKQEGVKPLVPICQVLPQGILQKLGPATTTPDTTAPVISAVEATSTVATSTHITWTTNEAATSRVWYSTSTPVQTTSTTPSVYSGSLVLNHDLSLSDLAASTTYYYVVFSADADGNSATTDQYSFTTTAQ